MLKHYIEYYDPGILMAESSTKEIVERRYLHVFPQNCYAYRLFDIEVVEGEYGDLVSSRLNLSGFYYNGGQIYTPDEVEKAFPEEKILISNIRGNRFKHAIRTSIGNWQEFRDDDCYILNGRVVT